MFGPTARAGSQLMGRPELGAKCVCAGCNERFYDLHRTPAICPKCGAEYTAPKAKMARSNRGNVESRQTPVKANVAPAEEAADDEDEEEPVEADDDDDDVDVIAIDPDREKTPD